MAGHAHNLRAQSGAGRPFGTITRGTTGFNRLRRSDRWTYYHPELSSYLRSADKPLAVDVGYGASYTTTVEWAGWLRRLNPGVEVVGLEIDPARVLPPRDGVRFELGGFELAGYRPHFVRAFNVLRQYAEDQVDMVWEEVCSRLAPGGYFVEGTCDEIGRRAAWVLLDETGPLTLTLAWDPHDVEKPSDVAERLPKKLIHLNRPGEKIYDIFSAADDAWDRAAGWEPYGPRVRWRAAREILLAEGVPLHPVRRRIRDNTLTVDWQHVAP
ncbi:class I SAM-dependent methyltransferase [Corynebacterium breve]|uniref:Class I SAM-dependent methyltransferase n=1 Tax=Corynebacterium breve TaxID=3049799 RepID=A0ABY8VGU1_9CORY|nr:class I SAM-dependent methyltransferase [Corynebacterium breve]WIM67990.1 class I SAM-dependent methyltransferase [Corynebacterium breve]